jgi:protein-S-isoprenylcysteine O-methyltransferase Ste14
MSHPAGVTQPRKTLRIPLALLLAAAVGAVIGVRLVRKGAPPPPPLLDFGSPMAISLYFWIILSCYWSWAARGASAPASSESRASRSLHLALVNGAMLLSFWPFTGWLSPIPPGFEFPRVLPPLPWLPPLGVAVGAAGLLLALWARKCLGRHWSGEVTAKVDHELIRSGPYRVIRHPIYTGAIAMYVGLALVSGRLQGVLALVLVGIAYARKIGMEERNLHGLFGAAWEGYVRGTKALVPWLL